MTHVKTYEGKAGALPFRLGRVKFDTPDGTNDGYLVYARYDAAILSNVTAVTNFLFARGAGNWDEADRAVYEILSKLACVEPDDAQERRGLYDEEVQKLADGVIEDIRNGHIKSKDAAENQLSQAVAQSGYVKDREMSLETLRFACVKSHWQGLAHSAVNCQALDRLRASNYFKALPEDE